MTASSNSGRFPRTLAVRIELYEVSFQMLLVSPFLAACDLRALGLFRNIIFFNFGEYLQCDVVTLFERA